MSDFDYGKTLSDGQHERHPTSVPDDRKFVRPVRDAYKHVGIAGPRGTIRDLTDEEKAQYVGFGYAKFEAYPPEEHPATGRFWTQAQLDSVGKGCGQVTTMGRSIAETYAAKPGFYGSTFCCGCGRYLPVGANGEFVWIENDGADKGERVGT